MTETKNNKADADEYNIKEDGLRLLTTGEIQLAKFVFLSTIDYPKVWISQRQLSAI